VQPHPLQDLHPGDHQQLPLLLLLLLLLVLEKLGEMKKTYPFLSKEL
jgi:hypothetical protein